MFCAVRDHDEPHKNEKAAQTCQKRRLGKATPSRPTQSSCPSLAKHCHQQHQQSNMEDTTFTNQAFEESSNAMKEGKGKVLTQTSLYAPECLTLLRQALQEAGTANDFNCLASSSKSRYASSSSDDEDAQRSHSESDTCGSSSDEGPSTTTEPQQGTASTATAPTDKSPPKTQAKAEKFAKRQSDIRVRKYVDTLTCHNFQLRHPASAALCLPTSMLSKNDSVADHPSVALQAFSKLAQDLQEQDKPIIVLFVRSGRFAGAVFVRGECVDHHTKTTYTIRKGQGKAQSAQDSQRRAKSVGSQLRRQGEEKLQQDITETAMRWKEQVNAAALVLVSIPKTMKKYLFDSLEGILSRDDARIRRVPLDLGRPTFENALLIHDVLTTVNVRQMEMEAVNESVAAAVNAQADVNDGIRHNQQSKPAVKMEEKVDIPLSALHVACKNADVEVVRGILASCTDELPAMAGPDLMTPLHYAAASSTKSAEPTAAAECVRELLVQGHADPSLLDGRGRPPYFLASHDAVRDAFRMARDTLGEDFCDWESAKVGPPLTEDDLQRRREKEAEKRRKKKARQKQKKAQEKAASEEMEQRKKEEEKKARQEEEAKRIRDGLQHKTNKAGNVCDFCQKECKGRKRNEMFKRLEYAYCSTECVQKHKRELQAAAALARFGG